jgi:3-hydroxyisobutyrate dehydrogenase-like beta-hydroxyacid dehydrogenase
MRKVGEGFSSGRIRLMTSSLKIAVIGLGEAGGLIARGLKEQGANVIGFDAAKIRNPPVPVAESIEEAVLGANIIISLNSSSASIKVAQQVTSILEAGAIYCDLNTGTPSLKRRLSEIMPAGSFVDVAVMKPVPGLNEKVPLSIAGLGAKSLMKLLEDYDLDLTFVSEVAGDAAARKLLRSILAKGMAAVAIDYLWAAKEMGLEHWALEEIFTEFDNSSAQTVQRYLNGTAKHAKRRQVEMGDVVEMLAEAGYESPMVGPIELTIAKVVHGKRIPFAQLED